MDRYLGRYSDAIYAVARIAIGLLFFQHGAQKLLGVFGGVGGEPGVTVPLFGLLWFAGLVEFVGGLMVATGFLASWAAFVCSGQMAVAYFMVHLPRDLVPLQNGGELAALYSWVFLYIAARGSGRFSLSAAAVRPDPTHGRPSTG